MSNELRTRPTAGQRAEDKGQGTEGQRAAGEEIAEPMAVVERILVAFDASPHSQVALRAAASVAAAMHAELQGLFVEDANLFQLCNSPFCREVGLRTAVVRQLEHHTVERQLRVLAAEMRRSLARVASAAQVRWSFHVARGAVEQELLAAAEHASLLSLGRAGWLAGASLGSTTRTIVQRTMRPLLILGNRDGLRHPLTVLYDGSASAERALTLAVRLAQQNRQTVTVLLVGQPTEVENWQTYLYTFLQEQQVQPTFALITNAETLAGLLQRLKQHTFVLPLAYAEWLGTVEGPVLLVP